MKEYGEREWAELSEKERQRKLIDLKIRERQLRKEGKMHEIANIIGSHLENEKCKYNSHLEKRYNYITKMYACSLRKLIDLKFRER